MTDEQIEKLEKWNKQTFQDLIRSNIDKIKHNEDLYLEQRTYKQIEDYMNEKIFTLNEIFDLNLFVKIMHGKSTIFQLMSDREKTVADLKVICSFKLF